MLPRPLPLLLKVLALFVILNLVWVGVNPLPGLSRLSGYNSIFPGRPRLPYGENPAAAYNLSLFQLEALFAAHELAGSPKSAGEFRVLLIGDSSVWGFLLPPADTLAAQLNAAAYTTADGRTLRAYNLGYPVMSLTKDLLLLDWAAQRYQPDLIVWLVTLESFPADKQLFHPLLQHNPEAVRSLITRYALRLSPDDPAFEATTFWDRTIVGQRRALADLLRLQAYGVMWAATGIDQAYLPYDPPTNSFEADADLLKFHELEPPHLTADDLALDALAGGVAAAGQTPVLMVNEPMFISTGANSAVRYNFFYPRWAYADYRQILAEQCDRQSWNCLDLWDSLPAAEFTNTPVHLTPAGSRQLADKLGPAILALSQSR